MAEKPVSMHVMVKSFQGSSRAERCRLTNVHCSNGMSLASTTSVIRKTQNPLLHQRHGYASQSVPASMYGVSRMIWALLVSLDLTCRPCCGRVKQGIQPQIPPGRRNC